MYVALLGLLSCNDIKETAKDYGTYTCSNCGYALFKWKQKEFYEKSATRNFILDKTKTINNNTFLRSMEPSSPTTFQVACGRCKKSLGHEFIKDGGGLKGRSHFTFTVDSLKYVPKRK